MTAEEKAANRELQQKQRAAYMAGELSHDAYYLWLADFVGLADTLIPVSNERVKASTDPHLNNIPLNLWDGMDCWARPAAYAKGLPWSLSDTVCCLKAMAKRRAQS